MEAGWPFAHSPFHPGEQRLQDQMRVREEVEGRGRRIIRDYLPQQHREFYAGLSYLLLAAVDAQGRPHIAFAWGEPGFAHSPEPGLLNIRRGSWLSSAFAALLRPGANLGALGIDLGSRRRNRVNGQLLALDEAGLTLEVAQSFGNCPKYIQRRQPLPRPQPDSGDDYSAAAIDALIDGADTFFIATGISDEVAAGARVAGVDMSHRGGRPGFVRRRGDSLVFPDFAGNRHYNTLGNLLLNPQLALLFIDFESGHLLEIQGRAALEHDPGAFGGYPGAERFVTVEVERRAVIGRLPWRWSLLDVSPALPEDGAWGEAD